jgi:hypothetical protein
MELKGHYQFVWGSGKDTLKMSNSDVLMVIDTPIPVTSRPWGLLKRGLSKRLKSRRGTSGFLLLNSFNG